MRFGISRMTGMTVLAVLAVAAPLAARAQGSFNSSGAGASGSRPHMPPTPNLPTAKREVAPGLPGARSDDTMVTPADRPAMQMRPTEALFDAINRGDIAASRDAIGRGAELNGRNILGLTPLELAVDLARKDIVFLLLSLRGADDRPEARPVAAPATPPAARRPPPPAQRVTEAPPPVGPRGAPLFAGDDGTPSPDQGFLGFGGERAPRR